MSVTVNRPGPVKQPPADEIIVSDNLGDKLTFRAASFRERILQARLRVDEYRDQHVRVDAVDARALGEALIEWADAVEA